MLESDFKTKLIKEIKTNYPDAIVTHLDPTDIQGIPDILVLNGNKWAALEGKKDSKSSFRPNQEYYIGKMDKMSFASMICPENKNEVMERMDKFFKSKRKKKNDI